MKEGLKQETKSNKAKANKLNLKGGGPPNRVPLMDRYQMKNNRNATPASRKTTTTTRDADKRPDKAPPARRKKKPEVRLASLRNCYSSR